MKSKEKGEICPFYKYPDCRLEADVCNADKWNFEKCKVYVEALESYSKQEGK